MEVEINHSHSNFSKKIKTNNEVVVKEIGQTSVAGIISESQSMDNPSNSNSDLSYHDNENCEDDVSMPDDENCEDDMSIPDDDDASDYDGSDDYDFDDGFADNYSSLQAQFDNVDLPPGVEASVSWLEPSSVMPTSIQPDPACATSTPVVASSSSSVATGSGSQDKPEEETVDSLMVKYVFSKRFDTVQDISDHHYSKDHYKGQQPSQAWVKKIRDEWGILANNLPDTIFVRVYESRMDLLTAVIVGPQGTPYHDGLFVFDAHFPPQYPNVPPLVHYYSGGLRLNPNLYECGKVCLSLLNTWTGKGNEKWVPKDSTMLQVLLSIQALILNAKPFFNEPGYEKSYTGAEGQRQSDLYNEKVFVMSLRTMIYTLSKPPKYFEDLVVGHFRLHARDILSACKAYINGAKVGSLVNGKLPEGTKVQQPSREFKDAVVAMVNPLISNFSKHGAKDCEQFSIS